MSFTILALFFIGALVFGYVVTNNFKSEFVRFLLFIVFCVVLITHAESTLHGGLMLFFYFVGLGMKRKKPKIYQKFAVNVKQQAWEEKRKERKKRQGLYQERQRKQTVTLEPEESPRQAQVENCQPDNQQNNGQSSLQDSMDKRSFEQIMGINGRYSKADLKQAYKQAVSRYHPDKYVHMSDLFRKEAEAEFKKIQQAYAFLLRELDR